MLADIWEGIKNIGSQAVNWMGQNPDLALATFLSGMYAGSSTRETAPYYGYLIGSQMAESIEQGREWQEKRQLENELRQFYTELAASGWDVNKLPEIIRKYPRVAANYASVINTFATVGQQIEKMRKEEEERKRREETLRKIRELPLSKTERTYMMMEGGLTPQEIRLANEVRESEEKKEAINRVVSGQNLSKQQKLAILAQHGITGPTADALAGGRERVVANTPIMDDTGTKEIGRIVITYDETTDKVNAKRIRYKEPAPVKQAMPSIIREFETAKKLGLISKDMTLTEYMQLRKRKPVEDVASSILIQILRDRLLSIKFERMPFEEKVRFLRDLIRLSIGAAEETQEQGKVPPPVGGAEGTAYSSIRQKAKEALRRKGIPNPTEEQIQEVMNIIRQQLAK